jgi:hypothetical protein
MSACVSLPQGVQGCSYGGRKHFQIVTQNCPERCWAASMAGIFGYNDHPIDQDTIAQAIFGNLQCKPAQTTGVLNKVLSSVWIDTNGSKFKATITGLYDPANKVIAIDNNDIVSEMQSGSPMLYCNKTHAMVIVGIEYRKDMAGNLIAIDDVRVADPYPTLGIHSLSKIEMLAEHLGGDMTYLASVDVDDV